MLIKMVLEWFGWWWWNNNYNIQYVFWKKKFNTGTTTDGEDHWGGNIDVIMVVIYI